MISCLFTDTMVSTGCCSILDNIVTFLFKKLTKKNKTGAHHHPQHGADLNGVGGGESLVRILEMRPEILQQVRLQVWFSAKV